MKLRRVKLLTEKEAKKKPLTYTTVTVPLSLIQRVDEAVNNPKYGYQNRSDFVFEAIRKRLRELGLLE